MMMIPLFLPSASLSGTVMMVMMVIVVNDGIRIGSVDDFFFFGRSARLRSGSPAAGVGSVGRRCRRIRVVHRRKCKSGSIRNFGRVRRCPVNVNDRIRHCKIIHILNEAHLIANTGLPPFSNVSRIFPSCRSLCLDTALLSLACCSL